MNFEFIYNNNNKKRYHLVRTPTFPEDITILLFSRIGTRVTAVYIYPFITTDQSVNFVDKKKIAKSKTKLSVASFQKRNTKYPLSPPREILSPI